MTEALTSASSRIPYRLRLASRTLERLLGLMDKSVLSQADALMLKPCNSIHSFGMPGAIDVAFIDRDGVVLKSLRNLPPRRLASCRSAHATLERFSQPAEDWFVEGERLVLSYPQKGSVYLTCQRERETGL